MHGLLRSKSRRRFDLVNRASEWRSSIFKEGDEMLKKLSIILSVAAVLGLGLVVATPDLGFAKNYKHSSSKHHYTVGKSYGHHVYYGHHRHRWHGRWYDYGVGPCWVRVGDIWFWNALACP
jgi:hypothetical protein